MNNMHMIVLIKQVPDPKHQSKMKADGTIERANVKNVMNSYDKNALEAALRVKDKNPGSKITAVSMGPPQAKEVLTEAIAMGADDAVLLCDRKLAGSDTLATSYALSKVIEKISNYDLIFCGIETTDGNTGQVGPEIAERLKMPQMTYVEDIKVEGGFVEARRMIEGGHQTLKSRTPLLITVTNTANEPRFPSMISIMKASKKPVATFTVADIGADETKLGLNGSPTRMKKIERPQARAGECAMFDEEKMDDFMEKIKAGGVCLVMKK